MIKHSNKLCETQFTETNQIMVKLLALSSRGATQTSRRWSGKQIHLHPKRGEKRLYQKQENHRTSSEMIFSLLIQLTWVYFVRSPSPGGHYNYHGNKNKITKIYQCLTLKNSLEHWHPIQHLVSWHSCLLPSSAHESGLGHVISKAGGELRTRWRRSPFRFKTALATLVLSSTSGKSFHRKSSVPGCKGLHLSHGQRGLWWTETAPEQTHRTRFPFSRCQTAAASRWFAWWAVSSRWFS